MMNNLAPAAPKLSSSGRPAKTHRTVIWDMIIATLLIVAAAITVVIGVNVMEDNNLAIAAAVVAAAAIFLRPVFTAFARSTEISETTEAKLKDVDVILAVVATMTGAPVVVAKLLELIN